MSDHNKTDDDARNDEPEPSIKVDGDCKDQVASEKNTEANAEAELQSSADSDQSPSDATDSENDSNSMSEPPPASFSVLVTMLFTQAMAMLGQMPDPNTGEAKVNKPFAKHYIDTLEMLETKTKGNLDDQEAAMLNEALHALRMMYVDTRGE